MRYDLEIEIFKEEWKRKFKAGGAHRGAIVRRSELHLYVHNHFQSRLDIEECLYACSYVAYFRLVMFSFGFHRVFHAGIESWYDYFFTKVRPQHFLLNRMHNVHNVFYSVSNMLNR